eukprot:Sdes_comp20959_c0_seq2m18711
MAISVTVFTGFLGAGKTTVILDLIKKMPPNYKIALLKNEFGDIKVDSELARENNIQVTEMMNGCLCCVLVGQMSNALLEIKNQYHPDRIIIETSGSAFPATIAWKIRELSSEGFHLDSIITVVDCVNFRGYEDTSYTAKLQAKYTDLILMNKWELVSEREYDLVLDHVYELNTDTPKEKVSRGADGVSPSLVFGLDSKLFSSMEDLRGSESDTFQAISRNHHSREVEILEILGVFSPALQHDFHSSLGPFPSDCESCEGDAHEGEISPGVITHLENLTLEKWHEFVSVLPKHSFYRIKGIVPLLEAPKDVSSLKYAILNGAFGRAEVSPLTNYSHPISLRITCMGRSLLPHRDQIQDWFGFVKSADGSDSVTGIRFLPSFVD